ncbi:MAG: SIR2 family protein [Dehalobacterium sp.]
MAASYGTYHLTHEEFAEFIRKECCADTAKPHKIHRLLTKLGPTCYVTTNYDLLLEQTLQKFEPKIKYRKVLNNQPIECCRILPVREKNYVFKLHGDMEVPETIVFNNEHYEAQYVSGNRNYASKTLENILLTRTVVFIGYGLNDPDFRQIIARIRNEFKVPACSHYALVAGCSDTKYHKLLIEEQQFLSPLDGQSLCFFHQSITEFLAGNYLATLYMEDNETLLERLKLMRWDGALLYTAGFLPPEQVHSYVNTILDKDMILAVRVCTYLEKNVEEIVQVVLEYVDEHIFDLDFNYWIECEEYFRDIPVTKHHAGVLRRLMRDKDIIGGIAAGCLIRTLGISLLDEMFTNVSCYNYLSAIGQALSPYITMAHFQQVIERIGNLSYHQKDDISSFSCLASDLSLLDIFQCFSNHGGYSRLNDLQKYVINEIMREDESQEALDWTIFQFKSGEHEIVFSLFFKVCYNADTYDLSQIDGAVFSQLISLLNDTNADNNDKKWGISLLYHAYQHCPNFAKEVRSALKDSEGLGRLAILYAIGKNRTKTFYNEFSSMLYWERMPTEIIDAFEKIDWARYRDHTDHIIEILIDRYPLSALSAFLSGCLKDSIYTAPPSGCVSGTDASYSKDVYAGL